jgi:hypothetical protein
MSPPRPLEKVMASIQTQTAKKKRRKPRRRQRMGFKPTYPTELLGIRTKRKGQVSMDEAANLLGWSTDRTRRQLKRDGVAKLSLPEGRTKGRYYVYEDDLRRVYPEHYERLQRERAEPDPSMFEDA